MDWYLETLPLLGPCLISYINNSLFNKKKIISYKGLVHAKS